MSSIFAKRLSDYIKVTPLMSSSEQYAGPNYGYIHNLDDNKGSLHVEVSAGLTGQARTDVGSFSINLKDLSAFRIQYNHTEAGAIPVGTLTEDTSYIIDFPTAWTDHSTVECDLTMSLSGKLHKVGMLLYYTRANLGPVFEGCGHADIILYLKPEVGSF